jgi:hypothetical protein
VQTSWLLRQGPTSLSDKCQISKSLPAAGRQMSKECQSPKSMVRQAHHDFILQHFQTVILSLSKDELWI